MREVNIFPDLEKLVLEYVLAVPGMDQNAELVECDDIDEDFTGMCCWDVVVPENEKTELVIGYVELGYDFTLYFEFLED